MLIICQLAYAFHNAAVTVDTRLATWPRQRVYHFSVRLRLHRYPGATAPDAHAAHGVLETTLSRFSWHVFVEAGTDLCA
jgi:hypothetical protein